MSKIKRMLENISEREDEIIQILVLAKEARPAFYDMVKETPSMRTVTHLVRDITDDKTLILLVTGYLSSQIKS